MNPTLRKALALIFSIGIVVMLTLAVARVIDWLWFYATAALLGLYLWYIKKK
jgi:hypothetical protein